MVNEHIYDISCSFKLLVALCHRAINYHLVASVTLEGRFNSVFLSSCGGCVCKFAHGDRCSLELRATYRAVNYLIVAAFRVAGRVCSVFFNGISGDVCGFFKNYSSSLELRVTFRTVNNAVVFTLGVTGCLCSVFFNHRAFCMRYQTNGYRFSRKLLVSAVIV